MGGMLLRDGHAGAEPSGQVRGPGSPTRRSRIASVLAPELSHLRALAVGTLLGALRDMAAGSMPEPIEKEVESVIDNVNEKLGGTPLRGRAMRDSPNGHPSGVGAGQSSH
jgi:hypothetical protein